jgi:hypothetical protein
MAPEQAKGEEVDGRVDVYALALLTFELVTGVPALDAPDFDGLMQQQLRGGVRALGSVDPALHHPQLDVVLDRATQRERDKRYPNMRELASALSAALRPKAANAESVPDAVAARREAPTHPRGAVRPADTEKDLPMPDPGPVIPAPPTGDTYVGKAVPGKATPIPLVTPYPHADAQRPAARWPLWVMAGVLLAALGGGIGWLRARPQVLVINAPPPPPASACPGMDNFPAELRELPTAELERRVQNLTIYRPSDAKRQLVMLKTQAEAYAPEKRDCMYRSMLLGSVTSAQTILLTQPGLWGHTRDLGRLKSLFMELPLKHDWSPAQREAVLERIETMFIAHLEAREEGDKDFWRRQYLGIELLCEVTDDALAELHTQRPDSCLNLKP